MIQPAFSFIMLTLFVYNKKILQKLPSVCTPKYHSSYIQQYDTYCIIQKIQGRTTTMSTISFPTKYNYTRKFSCGTQIASFSYYSTKPTTNLNMQCHHYGASAQSPTLIPFLHHHIFHPSHQHDHLTPTHSSLL